MEASVHNIVSSLFKRPFNKERVSTKAFLMYQNEDGTPGFAILEKSDMKEEEQVKNIPYEKADSEEKK